jgi:hypothetical protein
VSPAAVLKDGDVALLPFFSCNSYEHGYEGTKGFLHRFQAKQVRVQTGFNWLGIAASGGLW